MNYSLTMPIENQFVMVAYFFIVMVSVGSMKYPDATMMDLIRVRKNIVFQCYFPENSDFFLNFSELANVFLIFLGVSKVFDEFLGFYAIFGMLQKAWKSEKIKENIWKFSKMLENPIKFKKEPNPFQNSLIFRKKLEFSGK